MLMKIIKIKIINKNDTNKHIFFFIFLVRKGLTLVLRNSIRERKLGFT